MRVAARQLVRDVVQRATRGRLLWRAGSASRRVALTFDDGPHALTARYLDVLAARRVAATFFVMGYYVEKQPAVIGEYLRGGHQLASHGYYHRRFTRQRPDQLLDHLGRTERALGPQREGRWVRPPHGSLGPIDGTALLAAGYTVALWSFDSRDHERAAPEVIAARCGPDKVSPGDVILFHEGQEETLAALPAIIDALRGGGYELVTMADLFGR